MNDSEIIKALECCSKGNINDCVDCPFVEQCEKDESLSGIALDLINRQKAQIEELQAEKEAMLDTIHKLGDDYAEALEKEGD